ncbi:trypsin-like peptidase domain-containing protein [Rhodopirellula sp.]|jgi:serine protease Do|nr:trypsin-like peptidase domain-containing protein [Rhodopirellula sp.]
MHGRSPHERLLRLLSISLSLTIVALVNAATSQSQDFSSQSTASQTTEVVPSQTRTEPLLDLRFDDLEKLNEAVQPSIVTIRVTGRDGDELSIGTGFVISADGQIVTNSHVIGEGRAFTVELANGMRLPVLSIEACDQLIDLAVLRVDVQNQSLKPLKLSELPISPGMQVAGFGNPLGLQNSVVAGIISAVREVQGREMIQLAMPTQPGNSGGPLMDMRGTVLGIINMKSAIDDNLGFAIPVNQLAQMMKETHPVRYDRWVTLGRLDPNKWDILFGATWQQSGSIITARGAGKGFGGRSLCLSKDNDFELPMEIAVDVRLDDESGAAGLAFYADGEDRHYGFYPSNGSLRLTCFKGPSVYSWEVLVDSTSMHYRPGKWNRLRVRLEENRFQCFINDELFTESKDIQITSGQVGLVKFRDTNPDFKRFEVGQDLSWPALTDAQENLISVLLNGSHSIDDLNEKTLSDLAESNTAVSRELEKRASTLELKIAQMRRLAEDVQLQSTLNALQNTFTDENSESPSRLALGALLIAKLDNNDTDPRSYLEKIQSMAEEIGASLPEGAGPEEKRRLLNQYLFDENGFHGGRAEYYHPANSHLDRVIDDREGLPITLSILYMELGKRIGLDIVGIGLPGHFVVEHKVDENQTVLIDVFDRGKVLSKQSAAELVFNSTNRPLIAEDLQPQSETDILIRVVNNLLGSARRNSDTEAYRRYCEAMVSIRPEDPEARIMRSQARAITKRFSGAIEDVDWLIERIPEGPNQEQAIRLKDSLIADQQRENSIQE